ncbi:MAG: phosphate ABC transporter permease PstA [Candidatus Omnitrophica bacterium]|nr:phosphate ABC transporter permease PstA [Candidatus Omnitrophota bacterium]MCM8829816.1 phosphate ABC transporter permease PstA [Candidatus Omnitrophota bacterium]
MKKSNISQKIGFFVISLCLIATLFFLGTILYFITVRGIRSISWEFLTKPPSGGMTEGGVSPAILGTFYLTIGAILFALPLGLACAIYLTEYTPKNIVVKILRISINNLAGVPSVVFGLFGLAVFVKFFNFGVSILSGSLTLGILILPGIISASQEALTAIPQSLREASLALGASKWQTIRKIVLPSSMPGILTGVILSIGRAAGETAPIIFTAAVFYMHGYPKSIFSEVMALPYHIYGLMTEGTSPEKQTQIAYGCALILMFFVLLLSAIAIYFRQKQRRVQHG